jgi:hypothetical protein
MSRSYRRPYSAVTGVRSAKDDKRHANRGVRRAQNQYVRNIVVGNLDWDETPIPVRYECSYNETYAWGRDGKQSLQTISHNTYNVYYLGLSPCRWTEEELVQYRDERVEHQVRWIEEIQRK